MTDTPSAEPEAQASEPETPENSDESWFIEHSTEPPAADTEPEPPAQTHILQHPIVLALMLLASLFIAWKSLPDVLYIFTHQQPTNCGKISDRPFAEHLTPLENDTYCVMDSIVQSIMIMASGSSDKAATDDVKGRKYFLKLDGDKIFAVVAADRDDVQRWRKEQNSLLGFQITGPGRIIDPDARTDLAGTARKLRYTFSIDDETPIRLFDTTDHPWNHWPKLLIAIIATAIALVSAFFLIRNLRNRTPRNA